MTISKIRQVAVLVCIPRPCVVDDWQTCRTWIGPFGNADNSRRCRGLTQPWLYASTLSSSWHMEVHGVDTAEVRLLPLGSSGVKARKTGHTPCGCNLDIFELREGRWDRNRPAPCGCGALGALSRIVSLSPRTLNLPALSRQYRPIQSRLVPSHCCHCCCQPPAHPDHLQARYAVLLVCFSCYLMIETERNAQRHLPHFYHHMLKYLTTVADASVSGCAISPSLGHISRLPPPLYPRR